MTTEELRRLHPGVFVLDLERPEELAAYLRRRGLMGTEDTLEVTRAGEGNMNCTLRVRFGSGGSLVIKQARPWVEKYPQFAAPWDRAVSEWRFYQAIAGETEVRQRMPELLHFDAEARCLVLEDLGMAADCTDLYGGGVLTEGEALELGRFLGCLHGCGVRVKGMADNNRAMRQLNHAHVFAIPLRRENGLDLDRLSPGLGGVAEDLKSDAGLVERIGWLGEELYLKDGGTLLHGDFFPGSVLRGRRGLAVIDPEFCFNGRPEYDVGVWLGHLLLARQPGSVVHAWREGYGAARLEESLVVAMAGVEVLRRLIGYAQLPLGLGPEGRQRLLLLAAGLVREPSLAAYGEVLAAVRAG